MTINDIRDEVKRKFNITVTSLDTAIAASATASIDLLAPFVKASVVDTSLTTVSSTETLTIPPAYAGADLRKIMINGHLYTDYYKDGDVIYLQSYPESGTVTLFLRVPFTAASVSSIPAVYKKPLVELACADFATILAGDKTRYNIYSQSNGARSVDNMLDLADWYEEKAERRLIRLGGSEALA